MAQEAPLEAYPARLGEADVVDVVDVLSDAFADYPVMRFVLQESVDYALDLSRLIRFFTMARVLKGEPVLGVSAGGRLAGVALVSYSENKVSPPELANLRQQTWEAVGRGAEARYDAFGRATASFFQDVSRTHLNMIGVRRDAQGRKLGGVLLEAVDGLAPARQEGKRVSLTTEKRSNVGLYLRFGYEVVGHRRVAPELETWGMLKRTPS
jgi:ribosomal protein S18 acetylase RimI-like enzyme